jgi:hydro-lyases, Fe-S type, tartrate/fumarate subfamily, alpha region
MRNINTEEIYHVIKEAFQEMAFRYPSTVSLALEKAKAEETSERAISILNHLEENANIAQEKEIPICQDTGMAFVNLKIGQEIHFQGNYLEDCIQLAVSEAYEEAYLRKSVVSDPLFERKNTMDNTPAIIHYQIVAGDKVEIELCAKGFGSENASRIKMCTPAAGLNGVKEFVLETVRLAGPNACPPMVIGVGIGGSFDYVAYLAKKALLRPLDSYNSHQQYKQLEIELLEEINRLNIGPMGLGGKTTALKVNIEWFPTHIASLPVAVNINCHVQRQKRIVL